LVGVDRTQAVVSFNVLDVRVVSITSEEVKITFFRVILDHQVIGGLCKIFSSQVRHIIANLSDLLNNSDEKSGCVLVVGHHSNTLGQLL
jgi:hypothetical protein